VFVEERKWKSINSFVDYFVSRVSATSTEAFILRLFRQSNSEGFIKAFSDSPESFSSGFATLEKTMKLLYLRKVNLWPRWVLLLYRTLHLYPCPLPPPNNFLWFRFHVTVSESLESHTADVIELRQPMTKAMKTIQAAIIDCMDACLQELKRSSVSVRSALISSQGWWTLASHCWPCIQIEIDIDDFTVEKALFKSFDVIIRRQLDPIWHRVNSKTKQLVGDLKTLRNLLGYLVSYDSVNFNLYLETILATYNPMSSNSYWIQTDAAEKIFSVLLPTERLFAKRLQVLVLMMACKFLSN